MRWPRLLAVLVFALASPIQAVGNILGPDWTYKVNDMNLLDRLRMSPSISPECASALAGVRVNGSRAARADLLSGRVVETLNLVYTMFIGALNANTTMRDVLPIVVNQAAPFSSLGNPEVCRDYYLPGFHYCRLDVLRWPFRVGVCLPIGCSGQDVFDALLPKGIPLLKGEQYSSCGTHHYPPDTGTYVMAAVILAFALLVLVGSVDDWVGVNEEYACTSRKRRLFKAFSLKQNVALLVRPTKDGPLTVLDGIRGLSMLWVILGHLLAMVIVVCYPSGELVSMTPDHKAFLQRWQTQGIGSFHAVSAFLFVTGFLTMFQLLPCLATARSARPHTWLARFVSRDAPAIIFHRFMRISPAYYMTLGAYMCIAKTFITRTPYTYVAQDLEACQRYWWQNLLYIQNLRPDHMLFQCYLPSWYLAVDLQLLLMVPPLAVLAAYHRFACLALCVAITAACTVSAVLTALRYDLAVGALDADNFERFLDMLYVKPFYRAPTYLVGIMSGLVWVEWGSTMQRAAAGIKRQAAGAGAFIFASACTLIGLVVYGHGAFVQSVVTSAPQVQVALYIGLSGIAFSLGLALLLLIVLLRLDSGVLEILLTWRPLILLSRISFCTYLVHFCIILVVLSAEPGNYPFSNVRFIFDYIGYVAASVAMGLVLHLLVERPLCNLARVNGVRQSPEYGTTHPRPSEDNKSAGAPLDSNEFVEEAERGHQHLALTPTIESSQ